MTFEWQDGELVDLDTPDQDRPIVDVTRLADLYEQAAEVAK
jgi:hypothetical protein